MPKHYSSSFMALELGHWSKKDEVAGDGNDVTVVRIGKHCIARIHKITPER